MVEPTTPNADDSILCGTHRTALLESGALQRNPVTPLSPGNRETDCNQTSDPDMILQSGVERDLESTYTAHSAPSRTFHKGMFVEVNAFHWSVQEGR